MDPKRRFAAAASNLTTIFDQSKIQKMKVFDQNHDRFITKVDLMDTYAAMGCLNVPKEKLDTMMKEASGPINFTPFLTMFGERLKGSDTTGGYYHRIMHYVKLSNIS